MTAVAGLEQRLYSLKKEQVPEGSIVAFSYKSGEVELILSAKYDNENHYAIKQTAGSIKSYLSGESGIVLSRYIQGQWHDRSDSIAFLSDRRGDEI